MDCWLYKECNHKDCGSLCPRRWKMNWLYEQALVTLKQREKVSLRLDEDRCDEKEFDKLSSICKDSVNFIGKGNNLYIYSEMTGNGKTSWALRLLQSYFNNIWAKTPLECKALFINVPKFLLSLKDAISDNNDYVAHIKENIEKADLVIWDDIATKSLTTFEAENLLKYINSRVDLGKSNVYTSNICPKELLELVGDRLYSRIVNMSECVQFKGQDKRGIK